ncbi:hypothetical protein BB560_000415, partial [Smittium megazygosporum]
MMEINLNLIFGKSLSNLNSKHTNSIHYGLSVSTSKIVVRFDNNPKFQILKQNYRLSDSGDPARTINKEELNPNLFGIKSYKMSTKIQVPEVFDSSCNFDAEEWIERFELIGRLNGWSNEDQIQLLQLYLGKKELFWYKKNKSFFSSWETLKELF